MRGVWQISGGPASRCYADVFLKLSVALTGPGDAGPWKSGRDDAEFEGSSVRRFASEVQPGDIFVLRSGTSRIQAVGVVADEYLYLNQFDDVNGWDLQHARRVRWYQLPQEYDFGHPVFGANPRRFGKISQEQVLDFADRFVNSPPSDWQTSPLPNLPTEEAFLEEVPIALREIIAVVQDLNGHLYWDREGFGERPSEDEIVAHLVVPFLRSLGWAQEQIAVKWRYIDVALFKQLPRTPENCCLVVEAKHLGAGVEGALEQAMGYVDSLGMPRDVLVTDGVRYRMYGSSSNFTPIAYANLGRLKVSSIKLFEQLRRRCL